MRYSGKIKRKLEARRKSFDAPKSKKDGRKRPGSLNSHK